MEVFFFFWLWIQRLPLPRVYMKTLPIYLNCVRRRVAKIFLNQRIHPVRVSVSLSLVCPSVSFFVSFYYKPNVLESIWQEADRGPPRPPTSSPGSNPPQPAPVSHPPHVLHVNKKIIPTKKKFNKKTEKRRWQSKQGGSCCNQRCLILIFKKKRSKNHFQERRNHGWRTHTSYFSRFVSRPPPISPGCLV